MSHGLQGQDKNKNADHFASKTSDLFLQKKWVGKAKASWRRGPLSFREQRPYFFESGQGKERVEMWSNGVQGKNQKQNKNQTWGKARGLEVK